MRIEQWEPVDHWISNFKNTQKPNDTIFNIKTFLRPIITNDINFFMFQHKHELKGMFL